MTVQNNRVSSVEQNIEQFLSRAIPIRDVSKIDKRWAYERFSLDTYDVCFRVTTAPLSQFEILETQGDVTGYIQNQVKSMNANTPAPDATLLETHHPPRHLDEPLMFIVQSTA